MVYEHLRHHLVEYPWKRDALPSKLWREDRPQPRSRGQRLAQYLSRPREVSRRRAASRPSPPSSSQTPEALGPCRWTLRTAWAVARGNDLSTVIPIGTRIGPTIPPTQDHAVVRRKFSEQSHRYRQHFGRAVDPPIDWSRVHGQRAPPGRLRSAEHRQSPQRSQSEGDTSIPQWLLYHGLDL